MVWQPEPAPLDPQQLPLYVEEQLRLLGAALEEVSNVQLVELNVEPARPRDGLIVLADGTNWNPGSGAGYYGYQDGSWTFLG